MAPEKLPRDPQEHPRGAQEPPKRLSRAPKRSPRVAQNTLRTMVGSKTSILQNSSNVLAKIDDFEARMVILGAQNRPQEGRRGERTRLRRIYEPKKVSRELQEKPKMVSWLPRSSQETPKSIPEEPKSLPRSPQEHPKGAQETPKTLSEPWSDQKRRFFRIRRMSKLKSRFLRFGGSSWRLKIDLEEFEDEQKTTWKKTRTKEAMYF